MIQVKFHNLFGRDKSGVINVFSFQPGLASLFGFKAKNAGLNYDIKTRLKKAVEERVEEFHRSLLELKEEFATEKQIEFSDGRKDKTKMVLNDLPKSTDKKNEIKKENIVVKVDGKSAKKTVDQFRHDIPEEKLEVFNKKVLELLENDIEINCHPIKLSKLNGEEDTSSIAFEYLDLFINNDVE